MTEEILTGGGVNEVVRVDTTVRRPPGPHTPGVHALLRHLAARGFTGAPRVHGFDQDGREILDFLPGDVPQYPLPGYVTSRAGLRAAGALIRRLHDATIGFATEADWMFPPRQPAEVVCHGDLAPYNCVYTDGLPVAFIDFDTAHPGPRVWDVAYAAYRFVPLTDPDGVEGDTDTATQASRLRVFADAYGLSAADRDALADNVVARLSALVAFMRAQAAAGNAAFASHITDGHDALYLTDIAYVRAHAATFTEALR